MMVRLTFGRQAGEVVDLPPLHARAMLNDGRAVLPDRGLTPAEEEARESLACRLHPCWT